MPLIAHFQFHGSLNDFLRPRQRNTNIIYTFAVHQSVKDMIEANGVPYLEVRKVLVNGQQVGATYRLQPEDRVAVYPYDGREEELLAGIAERRFVLDVHLGTLAHHLRMLGFDTVYQNDLHDPALVQIASTEQRILLTRDVDLLKNKAIPAGYWLRSQHTKEQLTEVIRRFRLIDWLRPFTRCMVCNGEIKAVSKEAVQEQLPPKTRLYFEDFYQCRDCKRVYWKGSHYERMQVSIQQIKTY
ncbi:Mut7-C RNAse domain-containing protein [Pontibacter ramchanderi]|uniref:Twitching motility protein PilT n=1 Tax=Pontibacter ramchanderi TaxID=1179743 RepID=A0A2N3V378_9BACT|nr:Mut7-C RNAse domain-containing protein [Pontibacter ramchanderi]PKV76084.1 hypothetical protein BD749_1034 [Pontibacter ramchanderi]